MSRGRLMIGLLMGVMAWVSYFGYREVNPITGEKQHIGISRDQEVALGLQAAPESFVQAVGTRVAKESAAASAFELSASRPKHSVCGAPGMRSKSPGTGRRL